MRGRRHLAAGNGQDMTGPGAAAYAALSRARTRAVLRGLLLLCLLALAAPGTAFAAEEPVPPPAGYVTDAAGAMGEWAGRTEALCREIEQRTTAEVAVLTVRTVGSTTPQEYAQRTYDRWKIGKKGKDNGVLFLVAVGDRKLFIQTGYGVEGVLPDGRVGEIRDRVVFPFFRRGAYGEGIYRGVEAVGIVLSGGSVDERRAGRRERKGMPLPLLLLLLLIGIPILVLRALFGPPARRGGGGHYGGGFGGFGGGGFGGGGFGGFGGFGGGSSGGGGAGGSW